MKFSKPCKLDTTFCLDRNPLLSEDASWSLWSWWEMSEQSDSTPSSDQHVDATQGPTSALGQRTSGLRAVRPGAREERPLALFAPEAILPLPFPVCEPLNSQFCARSPDLVSVPNSQRALTTLTVHSYPTLQAQNISSSPGCVCGDECGRALPALHSRCKAVVVGRRVAIK